MAQEVLVKEAAVGHVGNIQPGHGTAGRHPTRAFLDTLSGHEDPGMFDRMFPTLKPLAVDDPALMDLAGAMKDADPGSETGNNLNIPAGFTYLGQFVDHDITLDLTSIGDKEADPTAVENFRTPALDLDSVYGMGPDGSRQLYARNAGDADGKTPGPKLLIGRTINVPLGGVTGNLRNDLPRSPEGFALIGDHRNDENLVVAQTHLAMLKFHHKVCVRLASAGKPPEKIAAWGDRLPGTNARFGYNADFTAFVPIAPNGGEGLLWVNHEYLSTGTAAAPGVYEQTFPLVVGGVHTTADMMSDVGGTVLHIKQDATIAGRYSPA